MARCTRSCVIVLMMALPVRGVAVDASQDALTKASILFKAGKVKQAEAVLRSASAADPNSPQLHGQLGELLLKEHRYEDSVQELGTASQLDPDSPAYNLLLSEALIGWKHYGVAVDLLKAVQGKFSQLSQFHYDLGLAQYNMNKLKEAQAEFEVALGIDPKFERAQFLLAACLASTGNPTKAVTLLRELIAQHPKNAIYWATLGQVLSPSGDNSAEAVRAVRRALALAPNDLHTQFVAANVFTQTGDFASARPLLEHLEKADPGQLAIHVQLARVYSRLGQRELARKETELASQLQQQNQQQQNGGAQQP